MAEPSESASSSASTQQAALPDDRYYWEQEANEQTNIAAGHQIWHNVHWAGKNVFDGMEFLGEVFVNLFGLNRSRYQDIYEMGMAEQSRQQSRRLNELQQLQRVRQAAGPVSSAAAANVASAAKDDAPVTAADSEV